MNARSVVQQLLRRTALVMLAVVILTAAAAAAVTGYGFSGGAKSARPACTGTSGSTVRGQLYYSANAIGTADALYACTRTTGAGLGWRAVTVSTALNP